MAYLWRTNDQKGEVLDSYVTKESDKSAALTFMKNTLKRNGCPEPISTDSLASYKAAMKVHGDTRNQEVGLKPIMGWRTATSRSDAGNEPCSDSDGRSRYRISPVSTPSSTITSTLNTI